MPRYFFNCDWGTTRFRLRLIDTATCAVLSSYRSDEGVASLRSECADARDEIFRGVLEKSLTRLEREVEFDFGRIPVLISGMATSTLGWRNLPYATLPFALNGSSAHFVQLDDVGASKRPVFLFSGVRGEQDVMRGEEMELIGAATLNPELLNPQQETWVILPGTHSKHVCVRGGSIVSFRTYMTGELFQLLGRESCLRHHAGDVNSIVIESLNGERPRWQAAFSTGVENARQGPLSRILFQVRSRQLLSGDDPIESSGLLSGLLVGSELAALKQEIPAETPLLLAASAELIAQYQLAADLLGLSTSLTTIPETDVSRLSALGQFCAWQHLIGAIDA